MNPWTTQGGWRSTALLAAAALLAGCGGMPTSAPHAFMLPLRAECGGGTALLRSVEAQPDGRIRAFTHGTGRADPPMPLRTDPALVMRWNQALAQVRFGTQDGTGDDGPGCALIRGVGASARAVRWRQGEAPPASVGTVFVEMMALRPDATP
ncbi:MAG: hypothetical protein QM586_16510 [Xenophilus sp.]